MKTRTILFSLILLLFATLPGVAQGHRDALVDRGDPVEMLLDIRRQLQLSPEQITELKKIQARLEAANRPYVERLLEIQREVQSQFVTASADGRRHSNEPTEAQMELARVPLRQIQQNSVAAMEEVNGLLTPQQKERAATLLRVDGRRGRDGRRFRWPGDDDD
jgi:hypothetical protein